MIFYGGSRVLGKAGQLGIPAHIREHLGLIDGVTKLAIFMDEDGRIILVPDEHKETMMEKHLKEK